MLGGLFHKPLKGSTEKSISISRVRVMDRQLDCREKGGGGVKLMEINLRNLFSNKKTSFPIGSMYGIFTYVWLIFMANVGKYTIHGLYIYMGFQQLLLTRSCVVT